MMGLSESWTASLKVDEVWSDRQDSASICSWHHGALWTIWGAVQVLRFVAELPDLTIEVR